MVTAAASGTFWSVRKNVYKAIVPKVPRKTSKRRFCPSQFAPEFLNPNQQAASETRHRKKNMIHGRQVRQRFDEHVHQGEGGRRINHASHPGAE
jgi:hypothetical protein